MKAWILRTFFSREVSAARLDAAKIAENCWRQEKLLWIEGNKDHQAAQKTIDRLQTQNLALSQTNETLLKRNAELILILNGMSVQAIQQALEKILPRGGSPQDRG